MPAKKPKPEEKPQIERFIETAREIEAGETEIEFENAFDLITKKITPFEKKKITNQTFDI